MSEIMDFRGIKAKDGEGLDSMDKDEENDQIDSSAQDVPETNIEKTNVGNKYEEEKQTS